MVLLTPPLVHFSIAARAIDAVKMAEVVDRDLKVLFQNGQSIEGVREIQYITITVPKTSTEPMTSIFQPTWASLLVQESSFQELVRVSALFEDQKGYLKALGLADRFLEKNFSSYTVKTLPTCLKRCIRPFLWRRLKVRANIVR